MPLISVIIPTHNRADMLAQALASVQAQTFTDFEILVISNGETPKNADVSKRVSWRAGAQWLYMSEGNRSLARNLAIKTAKGEWIAFLDDDDLWNPRKLALQMAAIRKTGVDCLFTDFILHDVETEVDRVHHIKPVNDAVCKGLTVPERFMVWRAGTGGCSTVLVKREVLLALGGFDTKMTLCEDWDMWRRIAQKYKVGYIEDVLSILRTHSVNGENHAVRRPWFCTYWEVYHIAKAIRTCPPELRHMIPAMLQYIFKRAVIWHTLFVLAGFRIGNLTPFNKIFEWGRPIYRGIVGNEGNALRRWLRPRRRINALFRREIFAPHKPLVNGYVLAAAVVAFFLIV